MTGVVRSWLDALWMERIDDLEVAALALRHPELRDRAAVENALSRHFFWPFLHQEVVEGRAFDRRARWSRLALSLPEPSVRAAAQRATARLAAGEVDDLLTEVRQTVTRAMVRLFFGDDALEPVVRAAIADFDRTIKMMGRPDPRPRQRLRRALERQITQPAPPGTALAALQPARVEHVGELVDHLASALLGTGIIQVTDVVTHSLIALSQTPAARDCRDREVIRETIRRYPVNASVTRRARDEVSIGDLHLRPGRAFTVVPRHANRRGWTSPQRFDPRRFGRERGQDFGFGQGPRACPARLVATVLAEEILGAYRRLGVRVEPGYRHRRSLAMPPRARLGPGVCRATSTREKAGAWLRYLTVCAGTYPAVAWSELVDEPATGRRSRCTRCRTD